MINTTEKIINILKEEIVPAEGCTEPIALAYAASHMTKIFGRIPDKMKVYLSGNMIKNVKSVHIPNSKGKVGIEYAVAMGAILGDSSKELMVIYNIDTSRLDEVKKYVDEKRIGIYLEDECPKLYIRIDGTSKDDKGTVEISDYHTNLTKLIKNGENILQNNNVNGNNNDIINDRDFLSADLIYDTAKNIDIKDIEHIFDNVIKYNSAIAEEGLKNTYGIAIGKTIKEGMEDGFYGKDLKNELSSYASAGSDARMNGCPLPVMTTSGSGNQGMTCSLPIIRYCQIKNRSKEDMIRGLFFSHLTTIHIKSEIGRLSAYCGAMAASASVSGALAFLDGLSLAQIKMAIENTLGTLSGVICDGAKSSCATKIAIGISAAVDGYYAAKKNRKLLFGEGIIGRDVEKTIENVGILGSKGMKETDKVILDIMLNNK